MQTFILITRISECLHPKKCKQEWTCVGKIEGVRSFDRRYCGSTKS